MSHVDQREARGRGVPGRQAVLRLGPKAPGSRGAWAPAHDRRLDAARRERERLLR